MSQNPETPLGENPKPQQTPAIDDGSADLTSASKAIAVVAIVAATALISYVSIFRGEPIEANGAAWGQFGDFLGGTINPVVGLVTVYLIWITVKLQRRELQASLDELKASNKALSKQGFENSFFSWLSTYQRLLDDVRYEPIHAAEAHGRHALQAMYLEEFQARRFLNSLQNPYPRIEFQSHSSAAAKDRAFYRAWSPEQRHSAIEAAIDAFAALYESHRYQFDSLFRTLFRIFTWVDEHDQLTTEEKWFYLSIVRAQLSWTERVFLLYNCLTFGKRMVKYANRYALFDSMSPEADAMVSLIRRERQEFKILLTAFNSDRARMALELPPRRKRAAVPPTEA